MRPKHLIASTAAAAGGLPLSALAHVDADSAHTHGVLDTFTHALAHPFGGADHLAAMLAVGAWSTLAFGRSGSALRAPAAFVALLVVGCLAGFAGLQVPAVEPMIAASVLVLGLLLMVQQQMAWGAAAALAGAFAVFHGAAHGYELAQGTASQAAAALLGMAAGSALLHAAGMCAGHVLMQRRRVLARIAGGGAAMLGLFMLTRLA